MTELTAKIEEDTELLRASLLFHPMFRPNNSDQIKMPNNAIVQWFKNSNDEDILKILEGIFTVLHHSNSLVSSIDDDPIEREAERRRDHWDILKDKCENDELFKEQWDSLMILLRLEEDFD